MEIDVYCKDGKCPICERDLLVTGIFTRGCYNGCYSLLNMDGYGSFMIKVFKITFYIEIATTRAQVDLNKSYLEDIKRHVKHWRKDYRYLAEILDTK